MTELSRLRPSLLLCFALAGIATVWHLSATDRLTRQPRLVHLRLGFDFNEPQKVTAQQSMAATQELEAFDARGIAFYNLRKAASPAAIEAALADHIIADQDALPDGLVDERLLGQIDSIEAGLINGWACVPGSSQTLPLQIMVYVDGRLVGETGVTEAPRHSVIGQLCELRSESPVAQSGMSHQALGFQLELPVLQTGVHEMRVYARKAFQWTAKQELPHSPFKFIEATMPPDAEKAVERERAIHQAYLDEVAVQLDGKHLQRSSRRPWWTANATASLSRAVTNQSGKALAVLGINSGLYGRARRDKLRWTWVNAFRARAQMTLDTNIIVYFVIGYGDGKDEEAEDGIREEVEQHDDILRVDAYDAHDNLSEKTLALFTLLSQHFPAHFYFKVDDDVAVNMEALTRYLAAKTDRGNLYMGCMKSGAVNTDKDRKYYEPEVWRFGESPYKGGATNYMRHASGQIYGMSAALATYLARSGDVLHRFANEDVTVGAWLVGLEVEHLHEPRFCCQGRDSCQGQVNADRLCISYYETQCAGICNAIARLESIYWSCIADPLKTGANGWWQLNKHTEQLSPSWDNDTRAAGLT